MESEERLVRCHLWLTGRVQGVGFRFFAERAARRLRVHGFVRNVPDGRVEVVLEGMRSTIDTLIRELQRGPSGAVVHQVAVEWESPTGVTGFQIR